MFTNRTLLTFIACAASICLTAQEHRTERFAGQEPTEVRRTETRQGIVDANTPDSLINVRTIEIRTYMDTLRTRTLLTDTLPVEPKTDPTGRKGHYVQFHIGGGMGSVMGLGTTESAFLRQEMNFNLNGYTINAQMKAAPSGVVQLQYAYFFHPSVGIGVGAWLANYTSYGTLSGKMAFPYFDSDSINPNTDAAGPSEKYIHHADIQEWRERQTVHTIGVPLSLQFQAWGKRRGAAGFFFDFGIAPVYTIKANYRILEGKVKHWGEYENWKAIIEDAHEFGTYDYVNGVIKQKDLSKSLPSTSIKPNNKLVVRQFSATAFFDLGLLIKLSQHTDMLLGLYAHYTLFNIQAQTGDHFPIVNTIKDDPYQGIMGSQWADSTGTIYRQLHPVEAGIKLGLHWHTPAKQKQKYMLKQRIDTTFQLVERHDSIVNERIETLSRTEHIQRQLDKLNRIYFAFDSYALTDDTKQFLADIAAQLQTIPNKVIIGGHASKEGTRRHNEQLAVNRALAVRRYLISLGIEPKRLIAKDYGSTVPNAINTGNEMSLDRRVEIIVVKE